ncbi:hypothetical protein GCM10009527_047590 [Actinomadura nitritigenes]
MPFVEDENHMTLGDTHWHVYTVSGGDGVAADKDLAVSHKALLRGCKVGPCRDTQ